MDMSAQHCAPFYVLAPPRSWHCDRQIQPRHTLLKKEGTVKRPSQIALNMVCRSSAGKGVAPVTISHTSTPSAHLIAAS